MEQRALEFDVLDLDEQELRVELAAEDVGRFIGNGGDDGDPLAMPNPLLTFVEAARAGLLARADVAPWLSGAERLSRQVDLEQRREVWQIRVWHLDKGAFRVLANLLNARNPWQAAIVSERAVKVSANVRGGQETETETETEAEAGPARLGLADLAYPGPSSPLPFAIDYEQPDRTIRDRYLQISFARTPAAAELESIYGGLDLAARLPLLGGYPAAHMRPWHSMALATPAFLLDPTTVELAFPDLFLCDDDFYAAVINHAHMLHHAGCPVAGIILR